MHVCACGGSTVWSYLVCLCVFLLVPPRVGMGIPREELGRAPISGSCWRG